MHEEEPGVPLDIDEQELNYLVDIGQIPDVPQQGNNVYQRQIIHNFFDNL